MKQWLSGKSSYGFNRSAVLAAGALIASTQVWAADVPAQSDVPKKKLGKVVVTAQAEKESSHPSSKLVTREILDNQQVTDMDDLVRYIPGVSVSDIGRFSAMGFSIRGLDGDRVAMTVDGLAMGETLDPLSYQAYDFFRSTRGGLDIDALKSVEIIKGADSIASGSGGLSGAVMFVTKDPADYLAAQGDDSFLSVKTGYASENDEALLSATLANRTGAWESLLVLTQRQSNEVDVQGKGEKITGGAREIADPLDAESTNGLFKLYFHASPTHRVGIVAEHYRANSQLDNLSRVDASYLTRTTDDNNERDRIGVNYQWLAESRWFDTFNWHYDYQNTYNSGYTLMLFKSATCPQAVSPCYRSEDRYYEQDSHSTRVKFSKNIASAVLEQELVYGAGAEVRDVSYASVDTRYLGVSDTASLVEIDPDFVPETSVQHWHAYVRDQLSPRHSAWTFTLGARADHYQYSPTLGAQYQDASSTVGDVGFTQATWQLGADYQFNPQQHAGIHLGTGFRAPSTENLYYATVTSIATDVATGQEVVLWDSVANPDLDAEESLNKELRYGFSNQFLQVNVAIFHDDYSNFIETQTLTRLNDTVFQTCSRGTCTSATGDAYTMPVNAGEVVVKGFEIDGQWNLDRNIALRFAYSYNEGEKKNGDPLLSIVPHSGVIGVEYQADNRRWAASLIMTRTGSKKPEDVVVTAANGTQTQGAPFLTDAFTLFDLQGRYQLTPALKVTLGLYNITDEQYWRWQRVQFVTEGAGGARGGVTGDGINRYAEPGRNLKASLSYVF